MRQWIDEVTGGTVDQFATDEAEGLGTSTRCARPCTRSTARTSRPTSSARTSQVLDRQALLDDFTEDAQEAYTEKERQLGTELLRELERYVILQVVDTRWREHLENMDHLREGVHLRAMAQKPTRSSNTRRKATRCSRSSGAPSARRPSSRSSTPSWRRGRSRAHAQEAPAIDGGSLAYSHESMAGADAISAAFGGNGQEGELVAVPRTEQRVVAEKEKIGRNDPRWCGSGKKYKKCHGA